MTAQLRATIRTVSLALAALTVAMTVTIATTRTAQASPPRWSNGPAHGHGYQHDYRHRKHQYRQRKHRRYYGPRRRHHVERYGSATSGSFLGGISGGNLIGGLLGAVTGTQFGKGRGRSVAILGGGLLGAFLGGEVQKSIQRADRQQAQSTLETVPTGRTVSWNNPNTGANYNITPTRTYQAGSGQYCREFTTWVFIGGYEEKAVGTACRMPDGTWQTVAN